MTPLHKRSDQTYEFTFDWFYCKQCAGFCLEMTRTATGQKATTHISNEAAMDLLSGLSAHAHRAGLLS